MIAAIFGSVLTVSILALVVVLAWLWLMKKVLG